MEIRDLVWERATTFAFEVTFGELSCLLQFWGRCILRSAASMHLAIRAVSRKCMQDVVVAVQRDFVATWRLIRNFA